MSKNWESIVAGYFDREHPYATYIFDDFGLDEKDEYYYDTTNLSAAEKTARESSKQRITIETVADNAKYGNAKTTYDACPITSGPYATEWVAAHNKNYEHDPAKTISTTHKVARHMGGALMEEVVVGPNVRDNLLRSAIAADNLPDEHPLMPVVREMVVKQMTGNSDLSAGQKYEDVDFMAKWYMKIDMCTSLPYESTLPFSRSTDKEIMRFMLIQAGLVPTRPDCEATFVDLNGETIDVIDIYEDMFDTARYQVGSSIKPKEALTFLLRMNDIFDHVQGKENKISAAREARGESKFPETFHPSMVKLATQHAERFEQLRQQVDQFAKDYAVACIPDKTLAEMDDKYLEWKNEGYGQAPSYEDGMSKSLRKKLEFLQANAEEIEQFFHDVLPHRDVTEADSIVQRRSELVELLEDEATTFSLIKPTNNGHWNPALRDLQQGIENNVQLAKTLEGVSAKNPERMTKILKEIRENSHAIRNKISNILEDQSIVGLRKEAREIISKAITLRDAKAMKPAPKETKERLIKYHSDFTPYGSEAESETFNDHLFEQCSDREQAILPFITGAETTVFPSKNQPYSAYFTIDAKTFGSAGESRKKQGVKGTKNAFGAAGKDSSEFTKEAAEYAEKAMAYIQELNPGKNVHGTLGDIALYKTIDNNPKAVAKKGGGSKLSSEARLLKEVKFTQLRDDKAFFSPGWERSEHEVQKRVMMIKMQLGLTKRDQGTNLELYTLPEDLDNAPANLEPDSLYESIVPLARHVKEEFEAGRKVAPQIALGLIRLMEVHAMLQDPRLIKRLPEDDRFNADEVETTLVAYMRDNRKAKLGAIDPTSETISLYEEFCERHSGLLGEPEIIRHIPGKALEDPALGDNYKNMQDEAKGEHSLRTTQAPDDSRMYVDVGYHR